MEEAQKSGIQKKQKIAINLGKGGRGGGGGIGIGIGVGVGIILVGGALTTAAFVANAFQKKQSKPTSNKNNNKTPEQNLFENNDTGDKTYDFHSNLPGVHSSPYIHQQLISDLMDKASESGDSRGISAQNLLPDLKCDDDQEISSCSKHSENQSMECNGGSVVAAITTKELSSSTITDSLLLHQSTTEDISFIAIELPERIDGIGKTNADQATEDLNINEITEAADEDDRKNNTSIFISENEETVCNHSDCLLMITDQGDEDNISGAIQMCEGKGINDCQIDEVEGERQPETPEVIEDKIHAQIIETEEVVELREAEDEIQSDATGSEIDSGSEQTNKLNGCQATFDQDAGVLDAVELLKVPKTENQTNEVVEVLEEEVEEKETQYDVHTDAAGKVILDVIDADEAQYDFQIHAVGEVIEEEKDQHAIQINSAEDNSIHAQIIETEKAVEEREGQDEVQIDAPGLEIDSGRLNECQAIIGQDSNHVLLTTTDDGVLDAVELLKAAKTENQINEAVEIIEEKKARDCTLTNATEEEVEKTDASGQVILNQVCNHEVFDADKLLEAPKSKIQPETHTVEGKEAPYDVQINAAGKEKKDQHDAEMNAAEEVIEDKKDEEATQHDVQINAAGEAEEINSGSEPTSELIEQDCCNHEILDTTVFDADELLEAQKTKIQSEAHTVEGKEAQYDVQINAAEEVIEDKEEETTQHDVQINAAGESNEVNSVSEQTSEMIEQDCSHVSRQMTSENILPLENEQNTSVSASSIPPQLNQVIELKGEFKDGTLTNATEEDVEEKETHQMLLDTADADELLEAPKTKIQPETPRVEIKEAQYDFQINAAGEVSEEEKDRHGIQINAAEEAIEEKEEEEVQIDAQTNAAGEAAEMNSGSEQTSELIELQTFLNQDCGIVSDQMTSENILPQENEQNMSQLIHQKTEKIEGGSQEGNVEKAGESSEGPMQVTKEIENGESVTHQKMEKEVYCKEIEDDAISSKSLKIVYDEKESSNMNLLKKYMSKLAEQNDEQKGILMRNRGPIVIGTMSALLCPLFHLYFGLPFLKICLIAVLVMVLSKIQGF